MMLGSAIFSFKTSTFMKVAVMLALLAACPTVTLSDECVFPDEPAQGQVRSNKDKQRVNMHEHVLHPHAHARTLNA